MSMRAFSFTALDTLMFRDGRPFNQGDEGASIAQSVFPPAPPTLIGALRLALAEQNGFDGTSVTWPRELLGDGVDWQAETTQLGPLRFSAALLAKSTSNGQLELLFPAPLNLAKAVREKTGCAEWTLLLPRHALETDIGKVRLPSALQGLVGVKTCEGDFLTMRGIRAVLGGQPPDDADVVAWKDLWSIENRVGIGLDPALRTARDGELYLAAHTRPHDRLVLQLCVTGLADDAAFAASMQGLGGEHRAAGIEPCETLPSFPSAPRALTKDNGKVNYAAIALAPVLFDELPGPEMPVPGLEGRLMSACLGKPQMIGGWNSRPPRPGPLPMRAVLPAGSVFFMECDDEKQALACHGRGIGASTEWGFGQVMIARWSV